MYSVWFHIKPIRRNINLIYNWSIWNFIELLLSKESNWFYMKWMWFHVDPVIRLYYFPKNNINCTKVIYFCKFLFTQRRGTCQGFWNLKSQMKYPILVFVVVIKIRCIEYLIDFFKQTWILFYILVLFMFYPSGL